MTARGENLRSDLGSYRFACFFSPYISLLSVLFLNQNIRVLIDSCGDSCTTATCCHHIYIVAE